MPNIAYYEKLIQEKRKQTPFRVFVKELGSWEIFNLYKRSDTIISKYHSNNRIGGLSTNFWEDIMNYQQDVKSDISFLEQFKTFYSSIPQSPVVQFYENENSEYSESVFGAKNAYLSFQVGLNAKDVLYSAFVYTNTSNIFNSIFVTRNCENIYTSGAIENSYNIFYSKYISGSSNIWFSTNLTGCEECLYCHDLDNQKYCINNITYNKKDYYEKKSEILSNKFQFELIYKNITKIKGVNQASENIIGEYIFGSKNIENGLWISHFINSRNIIIANGGDGSEECFDSIDIGINSKHIYAGVAVGNTEHAYCVSFCGNGCSHIYYSLYIENCHHCLGCIGLKNKSYCIFNTQYTKEAWEMQVEKIFASMEADGTLGDFFPGSMNPFYFNDTAAYLIDDSFTKVEVAKEGYLWRDEPIQVDIPEGSEIVRSTELDIFEGFDREGNWKIDPSIMEKVIVDIHGNYYRIVKMEYDFLIRQALPLPRIHWLERLKLGFR